MRQGGLQPALLRAFEPRRSGASRSVRAGFPPASAEASKTPALLPPPAYGSFACTSLLTALKSISAASGRCFNAPMTFPISFFDVAPVA